MHGLQYSRLFEPSFPCYNVLDLFPCFSGVCGCVCSTWSLPWIILYSSPTHHNGWHSLVFLSTCYARSPGHKQYGHIALFRLLLFHTSATTASLQFAPWPPLSLNNSIRRVQIHNTKVVKSIPIQMHLFYPTQEVSMTHSTRSSVSLLLSINIYVY